MNRGIYSGVSGMLATQKMMDVTANNLANVSTTAFKRDHMAFTDALEQEVFANSGTGPSLGRLSSGSQIDAQFTDFQLGPMQQTGRSLDVAIQEPKDMFKVDVGNGQYRYTRDGSFQLNANKELVTHDGYKVMSDRDTPIVLDGNGPISIDQTGAISQGGTPLAKLSIAEGTFQKAGQNLFESSDAKAVSSIAIQQGMLEGSNVNSVASMIEMIQIGRVYDLSSKSVTQQDELTQKLIQSLSSR